MVKGLAFVLITSTVLYLTLRRLLRTEFKARAKAEATAQRLQELETIAQRSSDLLYKHDLEYRFSYVSRAYEHLWGRPCESLYQNPSTWDEAVHPEDRERVRTAFADLTAEGIAVEYRIARPDGAVRWILDRAFPISDSEGKPSGVVGIAKDITEAKAAEQALRESELLYHTVFEAANDGILIMEDDRFIDCNGRALEISGMARQELLGKKPQGFSPEFQPDGRSSAEHVAQNSQRVLAGEPLFFPWQHLRPDGTVCFAEVSLRRFTLGSRPLVLAVVRDITEHIRAQAALRESEGKLRAIYTSMSEGVALHEVVCDAAGQAADYRILDVNPAFETITGLAREKVVGALATQAYGTGQAPYLEIYASVASSGEAAAFETYFSPIDKHFSVSVFCPRPGQFATVFSDISKRREAERQVGLLNQVYALISQINEAIVRLQDRDSLFAETCRIAVEHGHFKMAWIGLLDEATQEIRPVAWAGADAKNYLEDTRVTAALVSAGIGPSGTAFREGRVVICRDIARDPNTASWREVALAHGFRSSISLPLKTGGKVIGTFSAYSDEVDFFIAIVTESLIEVAADMSFALDLFERNREREQERQQLRLQHSALEAAANAIVITDASGRIEWVNEAFTRLTGYSRQEAIGANPRVLRSGVHEPEFYRSMWQTILAGSVWQGTLTNRRKDGASYEEEMTITPVRSAEDKITHFVAIKQNITERRKLEQQFLRAQRMQSIGLLAGGVAHDLNNVMAPVLMALPMLRSNLNPEQRDQIIETLEHSVKRGASIVKQVLTFARGVEVQRALVQLGYLVKEVVKIAEETFPRDIQVRSSLPNDLWPFRGDPTQIHQVILNLAVNARDAMPNGGQLSFTARNLELREPRQFLDFEVVPGRYISISVADTGTGIAPSVVERMFEPFFTTKPIGKGTGLGLSSVLGIVRSYHGLIEVQTRVGAGSVFTLLLPAAPVETLTPQAAQAHTLEPGRGQTVLIVDDEPAVLQITESTLQANGYRVLTARNGSQALAKIAEHKDRIQVVLTDVMMPVMDGPALVRSLAQLHPGLPVIAATGLLHALGDGDRAAQLRELGVRHFLHKPFQADTLLDLIAKVLDGEN
jgi:PAS domain S-box-containing protein